jgi:hypothetical protein
MNYEAMNIWTLHHRTHDRREVRRKFSYFHDSINALLLTTWLIFFNYY